MLKPSGWSRPAAQGLRPWARKARSLAVDEVEAVEQAKKHHRQRQRVVLRGEPFRLMILQEIRDERSKFSGFFLK